jgi:hypothetical protein
MRWEERRDLYPQGVASGDPHSDSVILWTRRPPSGDGSARVLNVEIAEDANFSRVVASAAAGVSGENDWTCRVLAADLKPARVYWYRFADEQGFGSRIGRTVTAPSDKDTAPVRFAFVSCQNVQQGASVAYRRMIWEDRQRPPEDRLGFVLHLGDFVYEIVWYPEDRPQGMYARKLRDIVRYPNGEKHRDFHVPTTADDYRKLYRAYLQDPDLQDARAHFPSCICGTTTNSPGRVGKLSRISGKASCPHKRARWLPARHGSSTSRPARFGRVPLGRTNTHRPPSRTRRFTISTMRGWVWSRETWRPSTVSSSIARCGGAAMWS